MSDIGGSGPPREAPSSRHVDLGCMRKLEKGKLAISQGVGQQVLPWSPLQVPPLNFCPDSLSDGL